MLSNAFYAYFCEYYVMFLEKINECAIMDNEVKFMKRYLIACDIDGTTLNHDGKLTKKTKETLKKYEDMGHLVVLATGRPLGATLPIYEEIGLRTPIVTDNGASIDHPHDVDFARMRTYIPKDIVDKLFTFAKPFLDSAFFSNETTLYAYQYDKGLEQYFIPVPNLKFVEGDFTTFDVEPAGMIFAIEEKHQKDLEDWMTSHYPNIISYRLWGTGHGLSIYEIYNKHTSKSTALNYLLEYYDIDKKNVIAFGDGINDIEMIRDSAHGVAMKNGNPLLKDVADALTFDTNDEDGLVKYLDYFFNQQK